MSEMIERVAKAIEAASQPPGQKDYKILMENAARAAIEAMREPTDSMIVEAMTTAYPTVAEAGGVLEQGRAAARLEWQAMIDAALSRSP